MFVLKVNEYTFIGSNFTLVVLSPFSIGSLALKNEFAPEGASSFL